MFCFSPDKIQDKHIDFTDYRLIFFCQIPQIRYFRLPPVPRLLPLSKISQNQNSDEIVACGLLSFFLFQWLWSNGRSGYKGRVGLPSFITADVNIAFQAKDFSFLKPSFI